MKRFYLFFLTALIVLLVSAEAKCTLYSFYNESSFLGSVGTPIAEGFDTIPIDSWIYHTRLPAYIPALDLIDDPSDPNDGPKYDLDGHFSITGNNVSYAPADELFIILDYSAPLPGNKNLFSTSPWYNALWPMMYDPNDEHPILTFDNFNNTNASINAFSLYYKGVTDKFIVFDFGTAGYVEINSSVYESGDWFFFGVISDVPFTQVQLHTNQNGSSIKLDSMVYSADATIPEGENPIPEPTTILLLGVGLVGLAGVTRRKLKK